MEYVELNSVVSEAMASIGVGSHDEVHKALARQWIWRAVIDLPVTEDNIKVCTITAKNLMLKKPGDMRRFLEIALYDESDCLLPHLFQAGKERIYPNNECAPVDISENEYAFFIGTNGENVSYAKVRYFAYPLDKDGMPMIREEDVETCVLFVRYKASMRRNDNRSEIQQNKDFYEKEADRQRAKRKSSDLSSEKKKTIGRILNRMIPSFNRSPF